MRMSFLHRSRRVRAVALTALITVHLACGSAPALRDESGPVGPTPNDSGTLIDGGGSAGEALFRRGRPTVEPRAAADGEVLRRITSQLAEVASLTGDQFSARYPVTFAASVGYDATAATFMDRIQASAVRLNDGELAMLGQRGFVITDRTRFPNFTYGYRTIYAEHLPLYVSADSILEAVHRSYDSILLGLEHSALKPTMEALLDGAHAALARQPADATRSDLDLYLSVARSLSSPTKVTPVLGGDVSLYNAIMTAATNATGVVDVTLFGAQRMEDFSQFTPRGHYTPETGLLGYFKAMMWLGRTDFRLLETRGDGTQSVNRRQVTAAFALRELLDDARMSSYRTVDDTIRAFVGEQDYLTVDQLVPLGRALGVATHADVDRLSDDQLLAVLGQVPFGQQRIASHLTQGGPLGLTKPLPLSFAFLGQRYVPDSHVFSLVVYDRVPSSPMRLMPQAFDAAFAALGNDHAGALLAPEIAKYRYAPHLAGARILMDEHGAAYWQSNLYNLWMSALRALSPPADLGSNDARGLFSVARTEPWARRLLSAQLASWSELRHDTLLYSKQSYTGIPVCEFPDGYVDPYPSFYAAIEQLAARGREVIAKVPFSGAVSPRPQIDAYFARLGAAAGLLRQMAEAELRGAQFTAEQLAFINQAVALRSGGCTSQPTGATGWYPALYYSDLSAIQRDPTIADVHTQPADEGGNLVGKVFHVATGDPRLMVVTTDTCGGPRAYVGLASSYFERITEGFTRLTDAEWAKSINAESPPDVPWMADLVAR